MALHTKRKPENRTAGEAPDFTGMVEAIRSGDPQGREELYRVFGGGIRAALLRLIDPQDLARRVPLVLATVAEAIQCGELREPERLAGFVWTVVRRQAATQADQSVLFSRSRIAEQKGVEVIQRDNAAVTQRILAGLKPRDREALIRFYLKKEPPAQICAEMVLTERQFSQIKSRARAQFERGRPRVAARKLSVKGETGPLLVRRNSA